MKYLRSRLQALPYDFEALDFALPSPLRGSVLLIFMARKGVAAPTALRRAAQVARLLRRRLPERRLHECLLAEEDPKVKDLKVKGVAKRARQVCRPGSLALWSLFLWLLDGLEGQSSTTWPLWWWRLAGIRRGGCYFRGFLAWSAMDFIFLGVESETCGCLLEFEAPSMPHEHLLGSVASISEAS